MATDREILNKAVASLVGGSAEPAADMLAGGEPANTTTGAGRAMQRRVFRIFKLAADAVAADTTTNGVCAGNGTPSFAMQVYVPHKARLVDAKLTPMAAVTSHNTTYATVNVTKDNGAGGSQTVILSNTTKTSAAGGLGSWAAASMINLTPSIITASDAHVIAAGSYLQLQIAKASTGVVVTACGIELVLEEC